MARFKYLGERKIKGFKSFELKKLRLPKADGTIVELTPKPPATRFLRNADIGYDVTDPTSLVALRVHPRFQEIV